MITPGKLLDRLRGGDRRLLLYAAFPKSASLYLMRLITESTGLKGRSARIGQGFGHSIIDRKRLRKALDGRSIVYGHIPCNEPNRKLIRKQDRRIVVSLRPLPEVVASILDHIQRTGRGMLDPKAGHFPDCYHDYFAADERTRLRFIIDYTLPWYFQFLVTWIEESRQSPVLWVTYEEITGEPAATARRIAAFCEVELDRDRLERFLADDPRVNFNKGVRGRGFRLLDEELMTRLRSLASYHEAYFGPKLMDYLLRGGPFEAPVAPDSEPAGRAAA